MHAETRHQHWLCGKARFCLLSGGGSERGEISTGSPGFSLAGLICHPAPGAVRCGHVEAAKCKLIVWME